MNPDTTFIYSQQSSGRSFHFQDKSTGLPLALNRVNEALNTSQAIQPSRFNHTNIPRLNRHKFLCLCEQSGGIYDSVRNLIEDEEYWEREDEHFRTINNMILDYNISNGIQGPSDRLEDSVLPAVETIRHMFHRYQRSLEGVPEECGTQIRTMQPANHRSLPQNPQREPQTPLQRMSSRDPEPVSSRTRSNKISRSHKLAEKPRTVRSRSGRKSGETIRRLEEE